MGRVYAYWVKMDTVVICIQRRWFYFLSRSKYLAELELLARDAQLLELREGEARRKRRVRRVRRRNQLQRGGEGKKERDEIEEQDEEERIMADDAFWHLAWHGSTCQTNNRNRKTFRRSVRLRFQEPVSRRRVYDARELVMEHRGGGEDLYAEDDAAAEDVEENVEENVLATSGLQSEDCRCVTDVELSTFFDLALLQVVDVQDVAVVRMAKALHLFTIGTEEALVSGRDLMQIVRKSDKHCLAFKRHDHHL
jgi:hypothetical protein